MYISSFFRENPLIQIEMTVTVIWCGDKKGGDGQKTEAER